MVEPPSLGAWRRTPGIAPMPIASAAGERATAARPSRSGSLRPRVRVRSRITRSTVDVGTGRASSSSTPAGRPRTPLPVDASVALDRNALPKSPAPTAPGGERVDGTPADTVEVTESPDSPEAPSRIRDTDAETPAVPRNGARGGAAAWAPATVAALGRTPECEAGAKSPFEARGREPGADACQRGRPASTSLADATTTTPVSSPLRLVSPPS